MSVLGRLRHGIAIGSHELSCLSDWPSRRRLLGLRWDQLRHGELADPPARSAVSLKIKALDGGALNVRPRSSDIDMIWCTYVANWHLPPPGVASDSLRRIVELGTNIGAGLAGLAARYPRRHCSASSRTPRTRLWRAGTWRRSATAAASWSRPSGIERPSW